MHGQTSPCAFTSLIHVFHPYFVHHSQTEMGIKLHLIAHLAKVSNPAFFIYTTVSIGPLLRSGQESEHRREGKSFPGVGWERVGDTLISLLLSMHSLYLLILPSDMFGFVNIGYLGPG